MGNGVRIDSQAIPKMLRKFEWKFSKSPVWVPLQADHRSVSLPPATAVSLLCRQLPVWRLLVGCRVAHT